MNKMQEEKLEEIRKNIAIAIVVDAAFIFLRFVLLIFALSILEGLRR